MAHGARARIALTLVLVVWLGLGPTMGQTLPDDAATELANAQRIAAEAMVAYDRHVPDRPLWREALAAGRAAANAAPDHPAPRRFLAQAYLQVGWYARSWTAWQAYLGAGGALDAVAERQLLEVASWMGSRLFDQGDRAGALPYLQAVIDIAPDDLGANARLARYYLDGGRQLEALPYLEALGDRAPEFGDDLARVRRIDRFGSVAAGAYDSGVEAAGRRDDAEAVRRFRAAVGAAPDFVDAWRGLGASLAVLGRAEEADAAHARVLELDPDDVDAMVGRALSASAGGDYAQASRWYERALRLRPDSLRIQTALAEADERLAEEEKAEAEATTEVVSPRDVVADGGDAASVDVAPTANVAAPPRDPVAALPLLREETAAIPAEPDPTRQTDSPVTARAQVTGDLGSLTSDDRHTDASRRDPSNPEELATPEARVEALRPTRTGDPVVLAEATVVHRRGPAVSSGAVVFVDAPELERDLRGHLGDFLSIDVHVLDKPNDATVHYQLCLVPIDISVRPACTEPSSLTLSGPGRYSTQVAMSDLSGVGDVAWRRGIEGFMLIARKPDGAPIDGTTVDGSASEAELERYLPMRARLTVVAGPR